MGNHGDTTGSFFVSKSYILSGIINNVGRVREGHLLPGRRHKGRCVIPVLQPDLTEQCVGQHVLHWVAGMPEPLLAHEAIHLGHQLPHLQGKVSNKMFFVWFISNKKLITGVFKLARTNNSIYIRESWYINTCPRPLALCIYKRQILI